jgi:CMP/dCMP kinase
VKRPVICLDGPAASGKTTIGRIVSERLGYLYLDTGVLYRAVTWKALREGIPPSYGEELARLAMDSEMEIHAAPPGDSRQNIVIMDGTDISLEIRSREVDANVSEVSAHPPVREALIDVQRSMAASGGVILAGRDMGTVVCPDAEVKVFLDASDVERARRRQRQAREQGIKLEFQSVLAEIRRRDRYDSSREAAPLRAAEDAVQIDSTDMSIEQVVDEVMALVRPWIDSPSVDDRQ